MTERCELSDLVIDQCACRLHAPTTQVAPAAPRPGAFTARYPGHCQACRECIGEGDPIRSTQDGYIHDECYDGPV